jgi:glycosyltransferase involved in cell wall biosynthesis
VIETATPADAGALTLGTAASGPPYERPQRVLFLVTEGRYFASHRLELARWLVARGHSVTVATNAGTFADELRAAGCAVVDIRELGRGARAVDQLRLIPRLLRLMRETRPDVVHLVALKPAVLGGLAAAFVPGPRVVHAIAGLGYAFSGDDWRRRSLRAGLEVGMRAAFLRRDTRIIVQNPDDRQLLLDRRLARADQITMIRGVGVDVDQYAVRPLPEGTPIVMLAARMLRDKGVGEFVEAARRLRARGAVARFVLVGGLDPHNRAAVPEADLRAWQAEGVVEWWDHATDMPGTLGQATIVALPSYREGLPKVLIEAAACGRPLVATDVPGCREVVRDGDNGLLVPARDAEALANAIGALLASPERRARMGARSRERAEHEFALHHVNAATFEVYGRRSADR